MEGNKDMYRVARVIRELERSYICHDYYDVIYDGVIDVLSRYGIFENLSEEEQKLLEGYMLKVAMDNEVREIIHLTEELFDPILSCIPDRPAPTLRLLQLEHKMWKNEMAEKRTLVNGL